MGIDARRFEVAAPAREEVRRALGVAPDEVLVTFAGVLRSRKGVGELIAAWDRSEEKDKARLLIIGKPVGEPETEAVKALVARDPRVTHLAEVPYDRIPAHFAASDVFFFPTRLEGFGIVVAEAMAAGLAVLTTRAKGVRTVVSEGDTALLTDVGAVDQMTAALDRLIRDAGLRRRLGEAGRRRVHTEFSWDRIMDRLLGMLRAA
jgi:phosphatidylinositol alpha-1,6-mannosyltransferase